MRTVRILGGVIRFADPPEPAEPKEPAPVEQNPPRSYHPKQRATDLSEAEWGKIHRHFPEPEMGPKTRRTPVRVLINCSLFRLENQIPLRRLQEVAPDFPPWGSQHAFENKVAQAGLWPTLLTEIGRDHLLPVAQKLIRSSGIEVPPERQKVSVEGLPG